MGKIKTEKILVYIVSVKLQNFLAKSSVGILHCAKKSGLPSVSTSNEWPSDKRWAEMPLQSRSSFPACVKIYWWDRVVTGDEITFLYHKGNFRHSCLASLEQLDQVIINTVPWNGIKETQRIVKEIIFCLMFCYFIDAFYRR